MTETDIGKIIKRVKETLDFSYGDWDPEPTIARHQEGHDWKESQILFQFLPATRGKYHSVGNLIGPAEGSPNMQYHEFGWCQPELVTIRCYAGKHHHSRAINGRLLADHFAQIIYKDVLKMWDIQLQTMGANIDEESVQVPIDRSIYHQPTRSFHYVYEISFIILTQLRWDDKPDDFVEEELVNKIGGLDHTNNRKNFYDIELDNVGT